MSVDLEYPLPGFPITTPTTMQDWVPIDGQWHSVAYVFHPDNPMPDLYVDGQMAGTRGGFAFFERVLSEDEIRALYFAGTEPK